MTPEKYAREVLSKFDFLPFTTSKKCALVTINLLISECDRRFIDFFQEVKTLIQKQK